MPNHEKSQDLLPFVEVAPEGKEAPVAEYEEVKHPRLMTEKQVLEVEGDKSSPVSPGHKTERERQKAKNKDK